MHLNYIVHRYLNRYIYKCEHVDDIQCSVNRKCCLTNIIWRHTSTQQKAVDEIVMSTSLLFLAQLQVVLMAFISAAVGLSGASNSTLASRSFAKGSSTSLFGTYSSRDAAVEYASSEINEIIFSSSQRPLYFTSSYQSSSSLDIHSQISSDTAVSTVLNSSLAYSLSALDSIEGSLSTSSPLSILPSSSSYIPSPTYYQGSSVHAPETYNSSVDVYTSLALVTNIVNGHTYVSNYYATVTEIDSSTAAVSFGSKQLGYKHVLSTHNRNIIIGCCVGLGIPLMILLIVLFYYIFIRKTKTVDYINSEGGIVTAYDKNFIHKKWYLLIGKENKIEPTFKNNKVTVLEPENSGVSYSSENLNLETSHDNNYKEFINTTATKNYKNYKISNSFNRHKRNKSNQLPTHNFLVEEDQYYNRQSDNVISIDASNNGNNNANAKYTAIEGRNSTITQTSASTSGSPYEKYSSEESMTH
ncbi:hypothetical protein TPHA_0F00930 [Tetrapisispora phaffii CBS 4417]|uniref:Mid2 domain-containing protein n=1 Tax=Tetrapisispora phaffii (strain ATCC 24235 / CBS 4417 / NBRC 1672 / NRRL Y-8282 / UCD 70-5) TaxID=1071381 RepID=G8BUZ7_TETPH|nr:hypothetical protein TPHA_0F00930 [Tetrapisispora phaffii CBS 4417]CCE63579.1 hypothetical protein TPHA_0F00930 [Tetrapisispora phaffii CBS 4417]